MPREKKCSDEQLKYWYSILKNIWDVADKVGMCGQSVHKRLNRLGISTKKNVFTKEDELRILLEYSNYASRGKLDCLAKSMNRDKSTLCAKAKKMGLTNQGRSKKYFCTTLERSNRQKEVLNRIGHPRGSLGLIHSEKTKEIISQKSIESHKRIKQEGRIPEILKKQFLTKIERYGTIASPRINSIWRQGFRDIDNVKYYFRSSWEFNYALYLQRLMYNKLIISWEYEVTTFWFTNIEDNFPSYRPDFKVTLNDKNIEYHEVKGWYDQRSLLKLKKMSEEFPEIKIVLIDKEWFNNNKNLQNEIEGWEIVKSQKR